MKQNNNRQDTPVTPETRMRNAKNWLSIIRFGESGTVVQLQDDCEYRVEEIIGDRNLLKSILGPYYKKYILSSITVGDTNLHASIHDTLIEICRKKHIGNDRSLNPLSNRKLLFEIAEKGYEVGLFLTHLTPHIMAKNIQPLIELEKLVRSVKNLSIIAFSEANITHSRYAHLADKCSFLYDHVIHYPLYGPSDAIQFLGYYSRQWMLHFPNATILHMYSQCGGQLWLLHQAARTLRDNPDWTIQKACTTHVMHILLLSIWNKFTKQEQAMLKKIHQGIVEPQDKQSEEFSYLMETGYITQNGSTYALGIPLLALAITHQLESSLLRIVNEKIFIGTDDVSRMFTKQENLFFKALLAAKKSILPRETIAKILWGSDWEHAYSDWALDRLAYRLRKKLILAGLKYIQLQTVKKKGFQLL